MITVYAVPMEPIKARIKVIVSNINFLLCSNDMEIISQRERVLQQYQTVGKEG
nr:MAG TPA: hypothetical protein [Caudoviricetes sp.]